MGELESQLEELIVGKEEINSQLNVTKKQMNLMKLQKVKGEGQSEELRPYPRPRLRVPLGYG